jgi:hypothetical protein
VTNEEPARFTHGQATRIAAAVRVAELLNEARAELETYAPADVVDRYTAAVLTAVGELQSPMWGIGYIHPDQLNG